MIKGLILREFVSVWDEQIKVECPIYYPGWHGEWVHRSAQK
jgi:hypothetical protein